MHWEICRDTVGFPRCIDCMRAKALRVSKSQENAEDELAAATREKVVNGLLDFSLTSSCLDDVINLLLFCFILGQIRQQGTQVLVSLNFDSVDFGDADNGFFGLVRLALAQQP